MNNSSLKILITGGKGQLASALLTNAAASDFSLIPCSTQELNITEPASIAQAISRYKPDVIINTAAYTAVDKAEKESDHAIQVNFLGAKLLALACSHHHIPLFHLSTDYIFDGTQSTPYREDDLANPINLYGKSKWLGEQAIREISDNHLILRVSGVFSEFGNNFLKNILHLAAEKKELRIVVDQTTCPTYAGDIANTLLALINNQQKGTFHYCSDHPVSWHQFASAFIAKEKQYRPLMVENIIPIMSADYPTATKRPAYSVLDCTKLKIYTGLAQPNWETSIGYALKGLHHE